MFKRIALPILILAFAATEAEAQPSGGGGRGGGGRGPSRAPSTSTSSADNAPTSPQTPLSKIEIVGVVRAIDPVASRITIAYEAVDALDWPPGSMPFQVSKPALLQGIAVGQKVRFKLESQQISSLAPY